MLVIAGAILAGCAPGATAPPLRPSASPPAAVERNPIAPPAQAAALGWMPLADTRIPQFARANPMADGRGVLIAILDSGVDPGVPGLGTLPGGGPKIADLRDFSAEGRITLVRAELDVDVVRAGRVSLRGASRIRAVRAGGPIYGGTLAEIRLGEPPAADLNGNGLVDDTLAVFVARATDGWVVFADTDGDGSLVNERPLRDYRQGRDTFGWRTGPRPAPVTIAVNLEDLGPEQPPVLDLYFDTSGHGTHVAGIAAGHRLYGIEGFDGAAPGAELLGLKIANDARGGISTTGAMVRAMDYAIRFARAQSRPLVINLSFGVGNEAEGRARIDFLVDSILARHPDVVMTMSAGNDGPGLSTIGLPASARRGITVGAIHPAAFLPPGSNGQAPPGMVAFFSARGGELAQPDLVAPGAAYSTVPRFDTGEEVKDGTSMAAPHVAGLAARLLSGASQERRVFTAHGVRRALMASARPFAGYTVIDQGAGLPDLPRAWDLLSRAGRSTPVLVETSSGTSGVMLNDGAATSGGRFRLRAPGLNRFRLSSDAPWVVAPRQIEAQDSATVTLGYRTEAASGPGVWVGTVTGWEADSALGPAFRLVTTRVVPHQIPDSGRQFSFTVEAGRLHRLPFRADSGRGVTITVADPRGAPLLAFLHEPGGMPWRGGGAQAASDSAAEFEIDARDAVAGVYELVVMAGPSIGVEAVADIHPAPIRVSIERRKADVRVTTERLSASPPLRLSASALGAERTALISSRGSDERRLPFLLPAWARRAVIELRLERDQWPLFTDFGLTLLEADGRQLGASPMNYHLGRLEVDLPEGGDRMAEVALNPGFADPGAAPLWTGRLAIRLYADSAVALGEDLGDRLALPPWPWTLGDGFFPLMRLTARAGDRVWHRETGLPEAPGPIMR